VASISDGFPYLLDIFLIDDVTRCATKITPLYGHSQQNRLLLVAFTERFGRIHIISARLATRKEREDYEQDVI